MTPEKALDAACEAAGTKTALAKALDVSPQAVQQWKRVPQRHVLRVEQLFGVSRHDLNPEAYPRN